MIGEPETDPDVVAAVQKALGDVLSKFARPFDEGRGEVALNGAFEDILRELLERELADHIGQTMSVDVVMAAIDNVRRQLLDESDRVWRQILGYPTVEAFDVDEKGCVNVRFDVPITPWPPHDLAKTS